ncbi:hypothetical protein C8R45DRAFT_627355 [Mycena sanguinolenta]|nr:hypothetical protein C8R45DRAFT_627355 [Mycena sanguinolenta]
MAMCCFSAFFVRCLYGVNVILDAVCNSIIDSFSLISTESCYNMCPLREQTHFFCSILSMYKYDQGLAAIVSGAAGQGFPMYLSV